MLRTATLSCLAWGALSFAVLADDSASDGYVGEALCRSCHSVEAEHWDRTLHARIAKSVRHSRLHARSCESCHGPGAAHVANPGDRTAIVAFTRESGASIEVMNGMCLDCHRGGTRIFWQGSIHEMRGVACSDCHNPMARTSSQSLLRARSVNQTCLGCHPQQRTEIRKRSRMPLLEGKMSCVDCHSPHGSSTEPLLNGDSVNQVCYACHAEKRGPFLWEHAPARESCLNCHHPHGSNHEPMLVAPATFLCQRCHSQIQHPSALFTSGNLATSVSPDARLINRGCANCHAQIHGSNHPSGPRFLR